MYQLEYIRISGAMLLECKMLLKATKSYYNLPVAHMQWFDTDETGDPCTGPCAKWHGYDRSVHFEFSGSPDNHGWIVGFGDLRPIKHFLEYYFDHTALIGGDDPRLTKALRANEEGLVDLRVLPYGVSMEMSSIFIWEQVNPFIYNLTDGRAFVSRVESREHEKNSAFITIEEKVARRQAKKAESYLIEQPTWNFVTPKEVFSRYV